MKKVVIIIICIVVLVAVISGVCLVKYLNLGENQLAILNYHHILPEADIIKYEEDPGYVLSLELFDEEMKYLYDNGYKTLNIDEFIKWKNKEYTLPEKTVMLTVDDGCTSLAKYVDPVLKKYNFKAISFVITDRVEEVTKEFNPATRAYVGKDLLESKKLSQIEYGSHSHSMHNLLDEQPIAKSMDRDKIYKDLQNSYNIVKSNVYSYPFSYFDKNIISALKESNFDYAMRGHNMKTYQNEHQYLTSRIGSVGDMKSFKEIFETDKYEQGLIDKIKGIWVKIKY